MKRTLKSITATAMAALAVTLGAIAPAEAGGSFTIKVVPTDAEQEIAMRTGLSMFALVNGMSKNGGISQNGINNLAQVLQGGSSNQAVIVQEGNDHVGTIEQNGDNNSCGLFQIGEATETHLEQNGDETCLAFSFGF